MNPSFNADVAREFLERYRPEGPWVLTMIDSGPAPIQTRTLTTLDDLPALLAEFNGEDGPTPKRNVYFSVNELLREFHGRSRAKKDDVARVTHLHVDVDPRVGEERDGHFDEERTRIRALMEDPPGHLPRPSIIVDSGGGYQAYWTLEEPIPIDGEPEAWAQAERYTKQIQALFQTEDSCYNVDRIMRVPGTVNWPNAKKVKKGRSPVASELVDFTDQRYPLSMFTPAVDTQDKKESVFGGEQEVVVDTGNIERVSDLQDLDKFDVPPSVKELIIHGDSEDKTKYPSRSEVLFAVVCGLVRCKVPDQMVYAIITDPDWPVSDSVLVDGRKHRRRGKSLERYAKRQIQRAHEKTEEADEEVGDALVEMNERHAVIGNLGGKCLIVEEIYNHATRRSELSKQTWGDLANRYANKFVEYQDDGKTKQEPLVKWWKRHPRRRYYDRMEFAPGRELPSNILNLWRGFAVEAVPGDCSLWLAHVHDNVCSGDDALYHYVMSWLARLVQKLDVPAETALVLRGKMGTGKNVFADHLGQLFGQHYVPIADAEHLVGRFNALVRDAKLIGADEAFYAGDKNHRSVLKALVTSRTKVLELKGVDQEVIANYAGLIMMSNEDWVVPAGLEERRFVVLDVSDAHLQDHPYFAAIEEQLLDGGYEALLYTLLTWNLEGFEVRQIPQTEGLRDQKRLSFDPLQQWWHEKLERGSLLPEHAGWESRVFCAELVEDFMNFQRRGGGKRTGTSIQVGKFLKATALPGLKRKETHEEAVVLIDGRERRIPRARVYIIPPLDKCRAIWDKQGGPWSWSPVDDDLEPTEDAPNVRKFGEDPV